ncbi:4048_t:CDS:2, partial [Racocetra persica]
LSNAIQNDHTKISYKVDRIKKIFSGTLKKTLHLKEDVLMDMKHMLFIIFVIFDSEALIFMKDITQDYINKIKYINVKKAKTTNEIKEIEKKVETWIKRAILIKVLIEIFCRNIPLIIIMAIYTSSIVVYTYMPFMALVTSCL